MASSDDEGGRTATASGGKKGRAKVNQEKDGRKGQKVIIIHLICRFSNFVYLKTNLASAILDVKINHFFI